MRVSGLDLAAESRNCSGYAVVDLEIMALTKVICLHSDEEIVSTVVSDGVRVVSVDSPLVREPVFRAVDREAIRRGFRVLPPTLGYMRKLAQRGWGIRERLSAEGVEVIETHPSSALRSSGVSDPFVLAEMLGVDTGVYRRKRLNRDLRDALVSALVGLCYVRKDCLLTVSAEDGVIYLVGPVH